MHLHTKAVTAVAMQEQGLIPGNQYAMWLGPIGYHDYEGLVSTPEEGERLAKNFRNGQVVLQKGHGFVLWGHSIRKPTCWRSCSIRACEVQIASLAPAPSKPYVPPQAVLDITRAAGGIITDGDAPFNRSPGNRCCASSTATPRLQDLTSIGARACRAFPHRAAAAEASSAMSIRRADERRSKRPLSISSLPIYHRSIDWDALYRRYPPARRVRGDALELAGRRKSARSRTSSSST